MLLIAVFSLSPTLILMTLFYKNSHTLKQQDIVVSLNFLKGSGDTLRIDPNSLNALKDTINNNAIYKDQTKIIEIFDKERSKYIELFTVVSILLTLFSLIAIVSSIVDRSAVDELKLRLEEKIKQYEDELMTAKWNSTIMLLDQKSDLIRTGAIMVDENNAVVSSFEGFETFAVGMIHGITKKLAKHQDFDDDQMQAFVVGVVNYINSVEVYALDKKYMETFPRDVCENPLIRQIINQIKLLVSSKTFDELKRMTSNHYMKDMKWGSL